MLKLDNIIKPCVNAATGIAFQYLYLPIPTGVNVEYLSVIINGEPVKRSADKVVFLYATNDPPDLLAMMSLAEFEAGYTFND